MGYEVDRLMDEASLLEVWNCNYLMVIRKPMKKSPPATNNIYTNRIYSFMKNLNALFSKLT